MRRCNGKVGFLATAWLLSLASCNSALWAQTLTEKLLAEDPTELAQQARRDGDIVRGAILFHQGNINCAKCHRPAAEKDRIGPDLSRMDQKTTDESIIESILQPSRQIKVGYESFLVLMNDGRTISGIKVREDESQIVIRDSADIDNPVVLARQELDEIRPASESSMPGDLANQLLNRQQFLDLLRYVIDVKERGPDTNANVVQAVLRRELGPELNGLVLMQELNCTACHASESLQSPVAAKTAPRLQWSARTLNPAYLEAYIANPDVVKPGSTMPDLLGQLDENERKEASTAITQFLLTKIPNDFRPQAIDGRARLRGFELFQSVGCVACHAPRTETAVERWLDGSIPLGKLAGKYNVDALTEFLEDPLAVRPSGHMPNMQLTHREAVDISNFLLQEIPEAVVDWKPDVELAKRGESLFERYNCASCHTDLRDSTPNSAGKLALEKLNPKRGCLSEPNGDWPNFHLSDQDRESIRAALRQLPLKLNDQQKIEVTLASFKCIACHNRGDFGGVSPERNPHFQTTNLNLGDQGRIPPTLTGVGAKLNPAWMRDVLVNRRAIRPYMKTRMPQFGEPNIGQLVQLFEANDRLPETEFAKFDDQKVMRETGELLAGNKGLNCVACHTYRYEISDTMPAVDLTEMAERLKKDWFYRYMLAPQEFSPNTVMPSFWPGGRAIRADIEGTPPDQIEALWQYLIDGRQARAPSGVVREPLEIAVTDEAQLLRRNYPGIGKRGIGVGYPGGVNIAFDAEQLRLGAIWHGKFAEASGVWRGQGSGTVRPLGNSIEFSKGPELDDADSPWVVDDGRPPDHHFKGYALDESRRPTFLYVFDSVKVEDFFSQVTDEATGMAQLRRSLTLSSEKRREKLSFRLATAAKITENQGEFAVGNKLTIRIVSEHQAQVVTNGDEQRLIVPLDVVPQRQDQLVIEYSWE